MGQVYWAAYVDGVEVCPPGLFTPEDVPLPDGEGCCCWPAAGAAAHEATLRAAGARRWRRWDRQASPRAEALISLARGGRWPACPPDAAGWCYVRDKVALKTHERLAAASAITVLTAEHAAEAGSAGGASGGLPLARRGLSIHAFAGHQLLGLRDGAGAAGLCRGRWVLDRAGCWTSAWPRPRAAGTWARGCWPGHRRRPRRWRDAPVLEARAGKQPRKALYQRAGFVVTGRRKGITPDGRGDACLMDKPWGRP